MSKRIIYLLLGVGLVSGGHNVDGFLGTLLCAVGGMFLALFNDLIPGGPEK